MTAQQLAEQLMSLPLAERVHLAEALWQSIGAELRDGGQREAIEQAARRDSELTSGMVSGRTHEEVMQAVRRASGSAGHRTLTGDRTAVTGR